MLQFVDQPIAELHPREYWSSTHWWIPMHRRSSKGTIRPKISTMPRRKSEAAAFLNIYKLVIEKKRLQEELNNIEDRREQIQQRTAILDQQIAMLEGNVQQIRQQDDRSMRSLRSIPHSSTASEGFDTLFLEY